MFLHERNNWTNFRWNDDEIVLLLEQANRLQGLIYGRLTELGFDNQLQTMAENITRDVVESSEIEGIKLNTDEVRSSIARRLGIENVKLSASSHYIDSIVEVMIDAIEHYNEPLTKEKLCAWQAAFFPSGYSGGSQIEVGCYRTHEEHVVSGFLGREKVHYIAPSPERVEHEMQQFIAWFNTDLPISPILRSAIAHLWFVTIHPFEDGNGRLARILSDIYLARGDKSHFRFYNISTAINRDKRHYYKLLEDTERGDGDITSWLIWYLRTLLVALDDANAAVTAVLNKTLFWVAVRGKALTQRQTDTLNCYLDGYEAKITSKSWAMLAKCSKDTAIRDIQDLVQKGVLREEIPNAKRPSYVICTGDDIEHYFTQVDVRQEGTECFLYATYKKNRPIRERILRLDAERYAKGELSLANLLNKYCRYLIK